MLQTPIVKTPEPDTRKQAKASLIEAIRSEMIKPMTHERAELILRWVEEYERLGHQGASSVDYLALKLGLDKAEAARQIAEARAIVKAR